MHCVFGCAPFITVIDPSCFYDVISYHHYYSVMEKGGARTNLLKNISMVLN